MFVGVRDGLEANNSTGLVYYGTVCAVLCRSGNDDTTAGSIVAVMISHYCLAVVSPFASPSSLHSSIHPSIHFS